MGKYSGLSFYELANLSNKEKRKAYTEMRAIANKRLIRLEEKTGKERRGLLPTLKELEGSDDNVHIALLRGLKEVKGVLESKSLSLTGQNAIDAKVLEKLQENGYEGINQGNLKQFGQFMDKWRKSEDQRRKRLGLPPLAKKYYDSDSVATLFDNAQKLGISHKNLMANFNQYLANRDEINERIDELEEERDNRGGRALGWKSIKALIEG